MRCESCNNLIQYFSPSNQYTCTLEGIKKPLELLLSKVDNITRVRIIGGKPLLSKYLPKLIDYLNYQKILTFSLVTNGTIDFKDELINKLKHSKKLGKSLFQIIKIHQI